MTHISVRPARHDLRVPTGQNAGEYFPTDRASDVQRTRYIERRLDDGDLVEEAVAVNSEAGGKKGAKE